MRASMPLLGGSMRGKSQLLTVVVAPFTSATDFESSVASITQYLRAPSSNGLGGLSRRLQVLRLRHWIIRCRNAAQGRRDCDDRHFLKSPGEQRRWEYFFDVGLKLQEEQLALHQQAINNGQEHERSNHGPVQNTLSKPPLCTRCRPQV
jgi:hypothetical protein